VPCPLPLAFRSSARVHRLLIAVGLLAPLLLFAGAAWKSRADTLLEGQATIQNAIAVLGDSVRDQLQSQELTLTIVADHLRGLSWNDIAKPQTSDFLVNLKSSLPQVSAISVADQAGIVRAASQLRQLGTHIVEQKFFEADRHGDLYVSATFTGQSAQPIALAVIGRWAAPGGGFDGTIHVELDPARLARLFAEAAPIAHDSLLFKVDGEILGESGHEPGLRHLGADDLLMQHINSQPLGGMFSGNSILGGRNEELCSYEHVPGYPVWVGLGIDQAALLRRWYASLKAYGAAAVAGSLALSIASWVAIRRARAEQEAFTLLHAETERRLHAERRAREAQRLEAVGKLAGGIAHDFNNLLTVLVGSLEVIGRSDGLSQRIQGLIAVASDAAERGRRLTSSLLAFARRQIMQTDTLNLNRLISDFLPVVKQAVGDTIQLELRLYPGLEVCRADAAQLEAALLNVVINARDAMKDRGTLTIATSNAELGPEALNDNSEAVPGAFVAVSVTDTGSGMSREVVDKAVEPFFTTKEIGQGSGLGLSQVLGFVRQLGGHLTIESRPARGSVVTLFLPQASAVDRVGENLTASNPC
jgi:signal transduction histidine kinase